jgi:uncharacterized membrane protein YfcA
MADADGSAGTGATIVLIAGTMTFTNEWYQTKHANWRIPVATLLGAAILSAVGDVSPKAATGIAAMVLIGAASARFNGKSAIEELNSLVGVPTGTVQQATTTVRRASA